MSDWQTRAISRAVKRYDRFLYATRVKDLVCVFRQVKRLQFGFDFGEKSRLLIVQEEPQFVLALTDNWTQRGKAVDWGIDDCLNRLRAMDFWANENLIEEMEKQNEKVDESNKRHFRNETEAFVKDFRRGFAKATDGIMTHSLSKKDPREKLDRRYKYGNCKSIT